MDLHYEVQGAGAPLIILHGLFGSSENWSSISRRLAPRFRVYVVDQRNHGRSPHSIEMNFAVMAEDVHRLMCDQSIEGAFLLGHSMGGKTAMQLALTHPTSVRKLVVADIAPGPYAPRHDKILQGMLALDLTRFETRSQMESSLAPWVSDIATRRFLLKNVMREPAGGFRWKLGLQEINQNYSRLNSAVPANGRFDQPTLFVRGETSDYLLESDLAEIRFLFPQAILKTIAGAGHWLHTDHPEAFVRLIEEFLIGET